MDRAAFDAMYAGTADPYGVRSRWYEQRKKALVLAALTRQRYRNAFEPACGVGELSCELAARCDQLLASDFSSHAVAATLARTQGMANVTVLQQAVPHEWPRERGCFDLIVLSEMGYFLDARDMASVAQRCGQSLCPDGTLVACHWTPDFDDRRLATREVHAMLDALGLARIATYADGDFELAVWERAGLSVAQREGIREAPGR